MANITIDASVATLQDDVAALKRDIGSLLSHLKVGASSGAHAAADQIEDSATRIYRSASAQGASSAKALGAQIEQQPLLALLVVLGLGYVGGRLLMR